mmetsp:Transcript_62333/g.92591  ORF Transcript_62333/g.92591 Transcript_62333/m.92591 type:complete len:198 (+) Transcript_62333:99-692(+)
MSTNTNERQQQQQQSLSQGVGKQASTFYTRPIVNPKLEEMDVIPEGATQEEFNSRPIVNHYNNNNNNNTKTKERFPIQNGTANNTKTQIGTLLKLRKVPLKIEPKVLLANERTFIAWIHLLVWLAGASVTIIQYSNDVIIELYGFCLLPVTLTFVTYALFKCKYFFSVCVLVMESTHHLTLYIYIYIFLACVCVIEM